MEIKSKFINKENYKTNKINIDYRFKIVYAFAMLSVISDHCRGKGSIELDIHGWFPYSSFHMPLFMFSAGYFFKNKYIDVAFIYILKKFEKLIFPIFIYNFFYGIYTQILKKIGFRGNIRAFDLKILLIEPLVGNGFQHIKPSWFSATLFYVEVYNIIKRKIMIFLKLKIHESIYFVIDLVISSLSVTFSNKGYNKIKIYMYILRILHLNIYYELGIFFNKHLEKLLKPIKNDIYFSRIANLIYLPFLLI